MFRSTGALGARSCGTSCDGKSRRSPLTRGSCVAATAAVRPNDAADTTRNTLLSTMQMENKLKRLAQELRKSERGRARARQRTLELLAGQRAAATPGRFRLMGPLVATSSSTRR